MRRLSSVADSVSGNAAAAAVLERSQGEVTNFE